MINVETDDREVFTVLRQLAARIDDMRPPMSEIGERVTESTQDRFVTSTAPDGSRWQPNSQATILAYLAGKSGSYAKKSGKLSAKGQTYAINKKPLVDSGLSRDSFHWQLVGSQAVVVGTDRFADEWPAGMAVHHFGSKDGRIPARPILGISDTDETTILAILGRWLSV